MLFRGDITEHGGSEPADHRRANARSDMVITGRNIRGERAERVERRPRDLGQLTEGFQFRKLRTIIGVCDRAGSQARRTPAWMVK